MTTTASPATASKIAKDLNDLVLPADIRRDYQIMQNPAMGSEVENVVTTPQSNLIDVATHDRLKDALASAGVPVSDEPLASIFEVKTGAHRNAEAMIGEMRKLNETFAACVRDEGYQPAKTGYLGHISLKDAMDHRIPSERADGLLEHFIQNGQDICARQPLMTTSVHLSVSYADMDHLYEMGKILMVLTPSLTALCENTGGVSDGQPVTFNPTAKIRLSQQDGRGGLSPVITAATSADDLMQRQADHIFTTPMMMHLDEKGTMQITDPDGKHPTMRDLQSRGLNTQSNALLSESMQYHMLKITSLRDSFGRMNGKRLEIRMADNGPFQHDFMALIGEAVGLNPAFRADLTRKLQQSGLDPYDPQTGQAANHALAAVAGNRAGAMEEKFGSTSVGAVAALLLDTLTEHYGSSAPRAMDSVTAARKVLQGSQPATPVIRALKL